LSLKNAKNRKHLIEEIRRKTTALEKENWYLEFTWIKAHAGHIGNELADKLAKEATKNSEICYNKIPKSEIERQESEKNHSKIAAAMGHHRQRNGNQDIFPKY
jgi:ribonuclease HI